MKLPSLIVLFLASAFAISSAAGQANASISVLTQNSGFVSMGGTVFLQVNVGNTGPTSTIGIYIIKVEISVPSIVTIPASGHVLPSGWTILDNDGSLMTLSNGTDIIPVNGDRQILIAMQGNTIGGPSTIAGGLSFADGVAPGDGFGSLDGNNTADDNSTSTVQVTNLTPITLSKFNAVIVNCQPVLNWTTETEINSDRFEIERANLNSSDWVMAGVVIARGNTTTKFTYSLIDENSAASEKLLYRLKIIDKDGAYKYSNVLPVFVNCKTTQVSAYPNPVRHGTLYVSAAGVDGSAEATLLSLLGQVIIKTKISNGTNSLDVSKVVRGEYILRVNDLKGVDKKVKIVIQN
ncbi:MAG: T9SS type A sorting domain-containing protein [Ginsengibacter sp.]